MGGETGVSADILLTAAAAIAVLMLSVWVVSVIVRDASIVDLVWGAGFVMVAWVTVWRRGGPDPRALLVAALTTLWGLRLSGYLTWRNLGKGEDFRYQAMRRRHGDRFALVSLGTVFGLQGLLMWLVSLPVQAASGSPLTVLDWIGVAVWLVGISFETIGDVQLAGFKADPANAGKVLDTGLWRYTRHPNYFGDFLVWWGLYVVAAAGGAWWTVIGPLVMSALLIRYSGAGLLEKTIGTRRPGYEEYTKRTNAFFPGPPG
jgi:steroid 5-alpha reductase family enzyme